MVGDEPVAQLPDRAGRRALEIQLASDSVGQSAIEANFQVGLDPRVNALAGEGKLCA